MRTEKLRLTVRFNDNSAILRRNINKECSKIQECSRIFK